MTLANRIAARLVRATIFDQRLISKLDTFSHWARMVTMKLAVYLADNGISLSAFARTVGAKNARTIQRYTKHGRVPAGTMMARIMAATDGKVLPNDFCPVSGE